LSEDTEVIVCPHCGSNLSDPNDVRPFNHQAIISWTGKQMCPNCHYYGFFLTVPKKEFDKIDFPHNKEIKQKSYLHAAKAAAHENSWILLAVACALMVALAYMILVPAVA